MAAQSSQDLIVVPEQAHHLPVTQADVDALSKQRKLFHKFIQDQMKVEVDYGKIPGTNKDSLFKPGAEKLAQLFGLGTRVVMISQVFDRDANFALFIYRAECFSLRNPEMVVSQCEGSCNSQEKKYKERKIYKWNNQTREREEIGAESTPICDVLNTLQKMAQKRAMVGAVIQATAASDFFTHDVDDADDADALGIPQNGKPAPTVIKAPVPRATTATSTDQSRPAAAPVVRTSAPVITPAASVVIGQEDFANYAPGSLFSKPTETIESVQVEIGALAEKLKISHAKFNMHVTDMFGPSVSAEDLNLAQLTRFRDDYKNRLANGGK